MVKRWNLSGCESVASSSAAQEATKDQWLMREGRVCWTTGEPAGDWVVSTKSLKSAVKMWEKKEARTQAHVLIWIESSAWVADDVWAETFLLQAWTQKRRRIIAQRLACTPRHALYLVPAHLLVG